MDTNHNPDKDLRQIRQDYATLFNTELGGTVLGDLMYRFNISRPHLTSDPVQLAFMEGQRSVVLHIFTMLRLSDQDIAAMMMGRPVLPDPIYPEGDEPDV